VTLTTSGGSGTGSVSYAVVNGTATGCSVSGSTFSFTSAGTCLVTATKATDSNYNAISSAQTTVNIAKGNQAALIVTSTTGTYPTSVALSTSGGSGTGAVSYAVVNGTATGCSVSGATLSFTSPGTCLVTATKATDTGYNAISSAQTTVTIALGTQATLTVTSTTGTYPTSVTLTTSGGSGAGAVSYAVVNGSATGCSVSGTTLSYTSAGTCLVTATKAADADYTATSSVQTTVTIAKANQAALTVTSTTGTYPTSVTLTSTGGSGTGTVSYAVVNGTASGCSVSGTTLSFTSAGTCLVTATRASDSNYNAVSSAQTTVTIAKGTQAALTITSTTGTYPTSVTLTTTGGTGAGAVSYAVVNGTASGCSVSGATLSFTSAGTCLVTATKALDTGYNPVSSAQTTVTIAKGNQAALIITSTTGAYPTSVTLTTSGGSGTGAVTYVLNSGGTATGCSVSGATLSFGSPGTCFVTATKALDTGYNVVSSAQTTITISKGNQAALIVTSTTGTYPTNVTLTTSGGSGTGAVSYAVVNGTATGCSVSGTTLSFTSAGTCKVTATKALDTDYNVISSAQTTVTIALGSQAALTITSTTGPFTGLTLAVSGGTTGGTVTYVIDAGGTATGCAKAGGGPWTLSATSVGTCIVTATMAGTAGYNAVSTASTTITLTKSNQATLTVTSTSGTINTALTLTDAGGSGTGADTFAVVNGTATGCAVNGTAPGPYTLTATGAGTCLVTATSAADSNYNVATSVQTTVTLYGTKLWSGTGSNATTVTSQSFTAPLSETVLVVVTYEGATAHACATPTGNSLNTYLALANSTYDATGGEFQLCTFSAQGTGNAGTITETFGGTEVASVIGVIEITGDNNATLSLAQATAGTSATPSFALSGAAATGATEFLFGALDNASGTPPTWNTITGFSQFATATIGSGSTAFEPVVYIGAPAATTIASTTTGTASWGTIGIEVTP
jgi:hypothetical protein